MPSNLGGNVLQGEKRMMQREFQQCRGFFSGFSARMLEDLDSFWVGDLFNFIESLIDHAKGVSVDFNLLKE